MRISSNLFNNFTLDQGIRSLNKLCELFISKMCQNNSTKYCLIIALTTSFVAILIAVVLSLNLDVEGKQVKFDFGNNRPKCI